MVFARAEPEKRPRADRPQREVAGEHADHRRAVQGGLDLSRHGRRAATTRTRQFALLALHEAERVGVSASDQTWRLAKTYWEKCQNDDGSWGYNKQSWRRGTGSMTCAGITSLVIAADKVQPSDARVVGRPHRMLRGPRARRRRPHRAGLQWLGQHYSVDHNPGTSGTWLLYYLYGLERAGRLTARRFIPLPPGPASPTGPTGIAKGPTVWCASRTACRAFGRAWDSARTIPLIGTSFALLFLSKGRWPVLLGKLQHGARRRLEPAPQRRGQSDPLRRIALETRPDLAGGRPAAGQRRGPAADAGAVPLRQPEPAARRSGRAAKSWPRSSATTSIAAGSFRRGLLRRRGLRRRLPRIDASRCFPSRSTSCSCWSRSTRSGTPRRRSIRSSCGRCGASSSAAAPAWSMPRPTRRETRGRRCRVCGSCRGRAAARSTAPRSRPRSTPPCRWASTCWPMPPTAN